jgi:IS30 family transposase
MAQHKSFTVDTEAKIYFCDPQSPWQRGSNENTNGLCPAFFRTLALDVSAMSSTLWSN